MWLFTIGCAYCSQSTKLCLYRIFNKVKCEIGCLKWERNYIYSDLLAQYLITNNNANHSKVLAQKKTVPWYVTIVSFKMECICIRILDSLQQKYLFFVVNSFLVLVIPTKCIISLFFYTTRAAQTLICDNLWNFGPQRQARPLPMMMSSVIYLPLKGQLPSSPSWLFDPMTILFHSTSKSGISRLTYWVTLAWKIRSVYYP